MYFFSTLLLTFKIAALVQYKDDAFYDFLRPLPDFVEYLGILFSEIVLVHSFIRVIRFERMNKENPLTINPAKLTWLKWILIVLFLLSLLWTYDMIRSTIEGKPHAFYMLWIGMSVMIYWLGHIGIYQYGIIEERKKIRNYANEHRNDFVQEKQKNEHIAALENLLVGQKYFLDASLTLEKVADELRISKSHLSRTINAELGNSFTDYLNMLRVEEAKTYLKNPDFSNYTLVAIGLEAGFNSKSSFNSAFKKRTGLTPSAFKNSDNLS